MKSLILSVDGVDLLPYVQNKEEGRPYEMLFWKKTQEQQYVMAIGS
ncbi:hypothetical protein [Colwellia echini]|nr:hypothetical protein [Colwellia echini]